MTRHWLRSLRSRWVPVARRARRPRPRVEALEDRLAPAVITVNSAIDDLTLAADGQLTLREAITAANTNAAAGDAPAGDPGDDTIRFAVGAVGSSQSIALAAALPAVTETLTIDGWSQGGAAYQGPPLIELNGAGAGAADGLLVQADNSLIRGLAINRFADPGLGAGIRIAGGVNNRVQGNFIGTNASGTAALPNRVGVRVEEGAVATRIGTDADGVADAAERNVISGNAEQGVLISGPATLGTFVAGNFIGTNAAGTAAVAN